MTAGTEGAAPDAPKNDVEGAAEAAVPAVTRAMDWQCGFCDAELAWPESMHETLACARDHGFTYTPLFRERLTRAGIDAATVERSLTNMLRLADSEAASADADYTPPLVPQGSFTTVAVRGELPAPDWDAAPLAGPADPAEAEAMSGVELIAAERRRQVEAEGWTAEHDEEHNNGELAIAAACYALPPWCRKRIVAHRWPWDEDWWKPSPENRVRELTKAGALIAAELDRLLRELSAGTERASATPPKETCGVADPEALRGARREKEISMASAVPASDVTEFLREIVSAAGSMPDDTPFSIGLGLLRRVLDRQQHTWLSRRWYVAAGVAGNSAPECARPRGAEWTRNTRRRSSQAGGSSWA